MPSACPSRLLSSEHSQANDRTLASAKGKRKYPTSPTHAYPIPHQRHIATRNGISPKYYHFCVLPPKSFSVAVVGGGIGGLALTIGLLKYPHIDVHVYESAPSFGEIGAGVALGPNAQRALELIAPEAKEAFVKHATTNMRASHANTFADHIVVR